MEELKEQMKILVKSMEEMRDSHNSNYRELIAKIYRLESNVVSNQEETARETARLVVKRIRKVPPPPQFKHKGNEKQYSFNAQVSDSVQAAAELLDKLKPEQQQAASILKSAREQLEEGMSAIAERQELIHFADCRHLDGLR